MSERPFFGTQGDGQRARPGEEPARAGRDTLVRRSGDTIDADAIWDPELKSDSDKPKPSLPDRTRRKVTRRAGRNEQPSPSELPEIVLAPALSDPRLLTAFPERRRQQPGSVLFWFVICVILPMLAATYYYWRVASNQYAAEFRFSVRDATTQAASAASSGLLAILGGTSSVNYNNYLVVDYLKSKAAVDALQKRIDVIKLYSKPEIDWWSRFNATRSIEWFVRYWGSTITTNFDQVTGIASAEIRAFSPEDTLLVANTMVSLAEELINDIANRSYRDAVRFAQEEVTKAETRVSNVRQRLTEYRNRVGVIDPNTSVVASSATLVQTLKATLAQQETQLATMMRQQLSSNAPTVLTLKNQIQSTKDQLAQVQADVGKSSSGQPLSTVMGQYEQLDAERLFAQTMLTSAMQALDQARANANAQHLYITPYVRPTLPTTSTYPRRILSVLQVGGIAFVCWLIALLVARAMRERFA